MPPEGSPMDMDPALEAEIEAALGEMSVADIDQPPAPTATRGSRPEREGTVVQIRGQEVLVEAVDRVPDPGNPDGRDLPPGRDRPHHGRRRSGPLQPDPAERLIRCR